jgi:hypothetical protein
MNTDINFLLISILSFLWAGWSCLRFDDSGRRGGINGIFVGRDNSGKGVWGDNVGPDFQVVLRVSGRNKSYG